MIPDSSAQQSFLRKHKKRQQFIRLMRLAVFLVFLLLWEVSARLGFIDSFIFGSPGQVCLAFRTFASDKPSALTYRDHRVRDTCQFLSCRRFQSLFLRPSLALSPACYDPGALPCGFEQPSEVGTGSSTDRMARCKL